MFEYYQGTWIGDDEISFGKNHHIQVLAGLIFLSNEVMATDEQPIRSMSFWRDAGSRKTGANSKTPTATKVDHGEPSLLADCPWAEEHLKSTGKP